MECGFSLLLQSLLLTTTIEMDFFREKVVPWILKFINFVKLVFHQTFSRNSSSGKEIENDFKNGTSIQILPNEVLSQIFEHLSLEDLIKCYETSQKWREVAKLRINHFLRNPDSLQIVSKHDLENLEVFSTLDEDRSKGILICMPNGKYIFGGSEFSQLHSGPITSKFLENGSKVAFAVGRRKSTSRLFGRSSKIDRLFDFFRPTF